MRVAQIYTALTPLILAREILAQNSTNATTTSAVPSSTTVNGTAVANPSAFVTKLQLSVKGRPSASLPAQPAPYKFVKLTPV
jgi:beta-glucosidase